MYKRQKDGSIEALLAWHEVAPGDFFYIPANTIHAIGAGIALIEVQQASDTTYRLYDYGRPRELHLDEGLEVAIGAPHNPDLRRRLAPHGNTLLVDGPVFRLASLDSLPDNFEDDEIASRFIGPLLVIPHAGTAFINDAPLTVGQCGFCLLYTSPSPRD